MKRFFKVCFFISMFPCFASPQLAPALVGWDGQEETAQSLPKTLAETGFDKNNTALFKPYTVNVPQYRSFLQANRYVYLPPGQKIVPGDRSNYHFPAGTAFIRDVYIDLKQGDPASRVFVEAQFQIMTAKLRWTHVTYHYKKDGSTKIVTETDNFILDTFNVDLNGKYPEFGSPTIDVEYTRAASGQCVDCHKEADNTANGFITQQLNNGTQLNSLVAAGVLAAVPDIAALKAAGKVDQWYNWDHPTATPAQKFFSYLAANCSHCHHPAHMEIEKEITTSFEYFSRTPEEVFDTAGAFLPKDTAASYGLARIKKLEMPYGDEESIPDWTAVKHMAVFINSVAIDPNTGKLSIHRQAAANPSNFRAAIFKNLLRFNRPGAAKMYNLAGKEIGLKRISSTSFIVTGNLAPGIYITEMDGHRRPVKRL